MTDPQASRVNVGELIRTGTTLDTGQAIALVHETCRRAGSSVGGTLVVPRSADDLWLGENGELAIVQSQQAASIDPRLAVAALLDTLLPAADGHHDAVPSSLRSLSSRLRASAESVAVADPRDLLAILRRYLPGDPRQALRELVARDSQPSEDPAPEADAAAVLTIPCIRIDHQHRNHSGDTLDFFRAEPDGPASGPGYSGESNTVSDRSVHPVPAVAAVKSSRRARSAALAFAALGLIVASGYISYTLVDRSVNGKVPSRPETAPVVRPERAPEPPVASTSRPVEPSAAPTVAPVPPMVRQPAPSEPATAASQVNRDVPPAEPEAPYPLSLPVDDGAFSPSFAPTGRELFFHSGRRRNGRMLEVDLDDRGRASRITPVIAGGEDSAAYHPRLSPDGRLIAFDSDRDGQRGVYVADRDGSRASRVSGRGYAAAPSWSPDMKWLAFIRGEPGQPRVWNLWIRELASGALTRQTSYRAGQVWAASWFPDSRHVCYSHEDQLVVADLEAGTSEVFRTPRPGRLIRTPAVSPDGRVVVFQVFRDGVWVLDVQARVMRRILDDVTAEEFAWDPAGRRIAYHSRQDGTWRIWMTRLP